jgi:predicted  nucleic acid-binding Zn-ribbon protein
MTKDLEGPSRPAVGRITQLTRTKERLENLRLANPKDVADLRAENERLREALEKIANNKLSYSGDAVIARRALHPEEEKTKNPPPKKER